jgi:hypothetical protein
MKDILQDIVSHTHNLGFLNIVKITGTEDKTTIDSMADDRTVIMYGETANPNPEMLGVFGMPQMNKLKYLLDCPEYKENASIEVVKADRNGETIPTGLHFENSGKDFKNDYRFMSQEIVNDKLKTVKMRAVTWNVEFEPTVANIQRLKFQASANAEEANFTAKTNNGNLELSFGDHSSHAGNFVFHPGVSGTLKRSWSWPIKTVISILDFTGDKTFKISDDGAAMITVDSGLAVYNYILPAQSK